MDSWIQVFRTGRHTDASGDEREWGKTDLDRIVSSYDPQRHEAPVVIGHPEDSAPAFGWVEALKREGEILYAKLKDLVPEFVDMVRRGLYKKRSIALYPDLTLRHVGFLGAMPPAIKGLEDVRFQERGKITICFSDISDVFISDDMNDIPKGGIEMSNPNVRDPGKEIERRIKEVLRDPRSHVNKYGRRFSEDVTYSQAFSYVQEEDPELAQQYAESLRPKVSEREKKALAAGEKIVFLVNQKMKADKGLSYSEALTAVQKENRGLILEYIHGK